MSAAHRPLELILARNLVEITSLPAFVVDGDERIAFYNIAAGELLGQRFEEFGDRSWREWGREVGRLLDGDGELALEATPLAAALRDGHPAQRRFRLELLDGRTVDLESSALPIVGPDGISGAIVTIWAVDGTASARG